MKRLLARVPPASQKIGRRSGNLSKNDWRVLGETNARDFFLVRCRSAAKRLAPDMSANIDSLTARLFPPAHMPEAEALAQLGPRILLHGAANLMEPKWWKKQDARTAIRCLRLLRLIGGPRATTAVASIRSLPSFSSILTGEWMLASSELCNAALPWPFDVQDRVWVDNTRVNDLRPLAGLTSLYFLSLAYTQVSDLRVLTQFAALQTLDLQGTKVSDLNPLTGLPVLKHLTLWNTRVGDLTPLIGLRSLQHLSVSSRNLAKDGIANFKRERPDVGVN